MDPRLVRGIPHWFRYKSFWCFNASNRVIRGGDWDSNPESCVQPCVITTRPPSAATSSFRLGITVITQPSAASIAIANTGPLEQVDDLYCEVLVDSIDPDGNSVTYTFDWTVDGSAYNGTPTTTVYSGDTLASETTAGEVWSVR